MQERVVHFSNRSFSALISEAVNHSDTETGGVLLGHSSGNHWYVLETVNSGPKSSFSPISFTYDQEYINYESNRLANIYDNPLELLGLWHQHLGVSNTFSFNDEETNIRFANMSTKGVITGILNRTPSIRLTMYYTQNGRDCQPINHLIGDNYIPTNYFNYFVFDNSFAINETNAPW